MRISILLLWTLCAAVSVIGLLIEARERSAERAVQDYAAAIAEGRVDDAIALIVPESRSDWRIFAEHQAGDRIRVLSAAVQRRALAADPRGWTVPRSVTVTGEITGKGGQRWRAQSLVRGRLEGGQWLLSTAVFGPDEPWLVPPES